MDDSHDSSNIDDEVDISDDLDISNLIIKNNEINKEIDLIMEGKNKQESPGRKKRKKDSYSYKLYTSQEYELDFPPKIKKVKDRKILQLI